MKIKAKVERLPLRICHKRLREKQVGVSEFLRISELEITLVDNKRVNEGKKKKFLKRVNEFGGCK